MSKSLKHNLFRQLISIMFITIGIIFFGIGLLLPKVLYPVYEKSLYQYLSQPLSLVDEDINTFDFESNIPIMYLYVISDEKVLTSGNENVINSLNTKQILSKINKEYGNFRYRGKRYYYYCDYNNSIKKIALTDDTYIKEIRKDIFYKISPIFILTLLLISIILILWCSKLAFKIRHLKQKVENIDNDNYIDNYNYETYDELKLLSDAIDEMKINLKKQEEYKNQMYQNISHDFKTPLTVIKSYMEALDDGIANQDECNKVIKEQVEKLENKVHSLLYLNKLNYIKDEKINSNEKVDIKQILSSSVDKFKMQSHNIKWQLNISDKNTYFRGTYDMWETIIDNILNNFTRYAKESIKITVKNKKITFYNDGPSIEPNILDEIFTPYKKGINGQFGLGLSIIKKTVLLMGYNITVKNERKGVSFMIY